MITIEIPESAAAAVERAVESVRKEEQESIRELRDLRRSLVFEAAKLAMQGAADSARACLEVADHIRGYGV